jgi:hypothetical protein
MPKAANFPRSSATPPPQKEALKTHQNQKHPQNAENATAAEEEIKKHDHAPQHTQVLSASSPP